MNENFSFKIKKLRELKGISQESMAFSLEISQGYLSKIENGLVEKIDFNLLQKISTVFKIDLKHLLDHKSTDEIEIHTISDCLLEIIIQNQEQINQLMQRQNQLISKLIPDKKAP